MNSTANFLTTGNHTKYYHEPSIMWQNMLDAIEDSIVILSPGFKIIKANKAFINTCYTRLDKSRFHLADNCINPVVKDICKMVEHEKRFLVKEYSEHDEIFELTCLPMFDDNKEINYFSLIFKNITERKRAEYELIKAKDKAEESNRLKTAFLQNLSHEIRTPLNAIVGFSQLLDFSNKLPSDLKQYTSLIVESSSKLVSIISDVIEISKIQAYQIGQNILEKDIIEFIDTLLMPFYGKGKEKNIDVIFNQNIPHTKFLIASDFEKLNKIFTHLIENALKFTHQGSVKITIAIVDSVLKFSVADSGIGISKEKQKVIFEPFRQLEDKLFKIYGGNGLGLAIVKAYVEVLNGHISLKSEINKGTTFYITIPINKELLQKANSSLKSTAKHKIILIVEDELCNYLFLKKVLEEYGYSTLHARDGLQAIDFCRDNNPIHLVLMDIIMPSMDGYTATKLLKEFRPDLTIIAQTGLAHYNEELIVSNGFDDFIPKPINKDILINKINKYLNI